MDRDANYVAVGTFVVVVMAMATVFVLWYSNARERREYQRYEVYFSGSVSGLTEGGTVRYLGVNVGRVADIRLDPRAADRVEALIDVDKATPITHDTLAKLTAQGITGLLFIDLSQSPRNGVAPKVADVPSQGHPVIRSIPSDFDLFVSGLPELVTDATRVTRRLNVLLAEDNLSAVRASLANLRAASEPLPATTRDVRQLVIELRAVVADAHEVTSGARHLLRAAEPEISQAAVRMREVGDHLAAVSDRIDRLLKRHESDIDRFVGQGLDELQQLAREGRDAVTEVHDLARSLKENPSQLLYEPVPAGVEIPR
ncbi:MAG: MlaD family protein [Proteobacteria bacterium]|nr:MlaD family protein [Pseudomonadota bacterium]